SAAPAPPDARDRRPRRGSSASDRHNRPSAPPAQGKALLISLRNIPPVLRLGDYFPVVRSSLRLLAGRAWDGRGPMRERALILARSLSLPPTLGEATAAVL